MMVRDLVIRWRLAVDVEDRSFSGDRALDVLGVDVDVAEAEPGIGLQLDG